MTNQNSQIAAYLEKRPLKQHEAEMLDDIIAGAEKPDVAILDIGCATGRTIQELSERLPLASFTGIDTSAKLLEIARDNLVGKHASMIQVDAMAFEPQEKFDIIIASGILSVFEDFRVPLERWLSWLAPGGVMHVFGRFNSRAIDTIVRFRNHHTNCQWEGGITAYATSTVSSYLDQLGLEHDFRRFRFRGEIPESADPIRTYTVNTVDGDQIVLNGANVVAEHYFLTIHNRVLDS